MAVFYKFEYRGIMKNIHPWGKGEADPGKDFDNYDVEHDYHDHDVTNNETKNARRLGTECADDDDNNDENDDHHKMIIDHHNNDNRPS